jgi:hypothetical protein
MQYGLIAGTVAEVPMTNEPSDLLGTSMRALETPRLAVE